MSALRPIDPAPFRARYAGPASDAGERPELQWVKISRLRIDPKYQREISDRGARNVVSSGAYFRWNKFEPVMISPIGNGLFAVINGQHRATGAALRGFESIPCCIVTASLAEQADAFVSINGDVTIMTPLQLHAARLAAGDPAAVKLVEACNEAGVTICRYPVPANKVKPGETLAIGMLRSMLEKFGRDVLVAALSCITQTRKGNPGMIRAQIVEALCSVLEADPETYADRKRLVFAMQTFDFAAAFNAARARSIESGQKVATELVETIAAHLESRLEESAGGQENEKAEKGDVEAEKSLKHSPAPADPPSHQNGAGLSIGRDEVSFNGRRIRVAPRAALLVAALTKAKPSFVGDNFLISKIWNVRPPNAGELLDVLVRDLSALKAIGLEVQTQRGVGRRLVEVGA